MLPEPTSIVKQMPLPRVALIEFPADDAERALRFWGAVMGIDPEPRGPGEGEGWVTRLGPDNHMGAALGVHERGKGPGDTRALPYLEVDADQMEAVAERVVEHGGTIIHPGERWTICTDSEGNPFGLAAASRSGA